MGTCLVSAISHPLAALASGVVLPILVAGHAFAAEPGLPAAAAYRFGQSRAPLAAVERQVYAAATNAAARAPLAAALAALLPTAAAPEAKRFFCEQLARIGGAPEVPALALLLADADDTVASAARGALDILPDPAALAALRTALPAARGARAVELAHTLGSRGDAAAVPALAARLADPDAAVVAAALDALGRIGGSPALKALQAAAVPDACRAARSLALLRAADSLRAAGDLPAARPVYESLAAADQPRVLRLAAFAGRVACAGAEGSALVVSALTGADAALRAAAVQALSGKDGAVALGHVARQLETLPEDVQGQVLTLLPASGQTAALPGVLQALRSPNADVRAAALAAAGALGDASTVDALVTAGAALAAAEQPLLGNSLRSLRGAGVDAALAGALPRAAPELQVVLVRVLTARNAVATAPALLQIAGGGEPAVRRECFKALGDLGTAATCDALLAKLAEAPAGDQAAMQAALGSICRRLRSAAPVVQALKKAPAARQPPLLAVLGLAGGTEALEALRAAARDPAPETQLAAVRALADWPDAAPLDDLLAVAGKTADAKTKLLALRGVANLAVHDTSRPPAARKAALQAVMAGTDDAAIRGEALAGLAVLDVWANLARGATATSPDDVESDGQAGGDGAAIDGNLGTYWDETDNRPLYRLRVALKAPATVCALRITGFVHHEYAPKDFEVLCDDKVAHRVANAVYQDNVLVVALPAPVVCQAVELKITAAHGPSPAIRELEILGETKP